MQAQTLMQIPIIIIIIISKIPMIQIKRIPQTVQAPRKNVRPAKNRKYVDGSNENVSYKSAAHIAPGAAGNAVRAHEGEHVSNAYTKASQNNGKVISASVSIHTSVCPECGRTYVSGGTTNTMIKYPNESNPYQQERKSQDALRFTGNNIDYVA